MDKTKAAPRRLMESRRFWSSIISIITLEMLPRGRSWKSI